MQAARALADQGWTTPQKMAAATWEQRTRALNEAGYARYDESTSRMLGDTAGMLVEPVRRRSAQAARGRRKESRVASARLLKECKGLGDVGVSIFFREVQFAWDELYPFADKRALDAARRLGLASDAQALARQVPRNEFPRLVAALVRGGLAKDLEGVLEAARSRRGRMSRIGNVSRPRGVAKMRGASEGDLVVRRQSLCAAPSSASWLPT